MQKHTQIVGCWLCLAGASCLSGCLFSDFDEIVIDGVRDDDTVLDLASFEDREVLKPAMASVTFFTALANGEYSAAYACLSPGAKRSFAPSQVDPRRTDAPPLEELTLAEFTALISAIDECYGTLEPLYGDAVWVDAEYLSVDPNSPETARCRMVCECDFQPNEDLIARIAKARGVDIQQARADYEGDTSLEIVVVMVEVDGEFLVGDFRVHGNGYEQFQ